MSRDVCGELFILGELVKVIGGKVPSLSELNVGRYGQKMDAPDADLRSLISPVIRKNATPEAVDQAAEKLEQYVAKHPTVGTQIGDIARRIIRADKLKNYGTPRAQEFLRKWAQQYKPASPKSDEGNAKAKTDE